MGEHVTLLENLSLDEDNNNMIVEAPTGLNTDIAMDLSLSPFYRLKSLNELSYEEQYEICKRLIMMFHLSETKTIKEYLVDIAIDSYVSSSLKLDICEMLIDEDTSSYNHLDQVLMDITVGDYSETDVKSECVLASIIKLSECKDLYDNMFEHLTRFINDYLLDIEYRFRMVVSLKNQKNIDHIEVHKVFFDNVDNHIRYRILSAQHLLIGTKNTDIRKHVQDTVLEFMEDHELDENVRAD